jgi:two-component system, OmpR family, sensor histidine kinase VicK
MEESNNYEIFKNLIKRTNKILFAFDVNSASITFLNNAFSPIWRRTRESAIASPVVILDAIHPDDRPYLAQEYQELLSGILKENLEFRIRLPDQSIKWLLLNPHLYTDSEGNRIVAGIAEDVTLIKDNISNLQKFASKKNSILEILSHDLAGPLANIQGLSDVLSEYTREYGNEEVDRIIKIIRETSERNIRLIRDFVHHEFLESSNVELFRQRVNIVRRIQEVVEQYKEGAGHVQKQIHFTSSSDKIYIHLDDTKFMQVINNLFSNAIKFTPDHGTISLDLAEQEETVLITLKDTGIGIPRRYHDRLFEKFSPARREGLRGEPSTGLGMSIIKTIVEWHNGSIWFESEEKAGTTFYIKLPKE